MTQRPKKPLTVLALCAAILPAWPSHSAAADPSGQVTSRAAKNHTLDLDGALPMTIQPDDTATQDVSSLDLGADDAARYKRNEIVGKYLRISDELCSDYLQQLTRTKRTYSLIFGSLSTLFGAAGSAFTQASVVRPLSALAAVSSGERAEFDADTFVQQTAQVIIAGIKNSRARTYNTIVQVNFLKKVTDWPLSLALADVQDYHSRCSLQEGITEAAASISAVAPQSTPVTADNQSGVAGRSESPPSNAAVAGNAANSATAGAVAAVAASRGSTPILVANASAGGVAGGATAVSGNASPQAASAAGAAVIEKVDAPPVAVTVPPPVPPSAADIARAQLALVKRAHASIVVDGAMGRDTVAALKAFQAAQKPPILATGRIDKATTAALGAGAPAIIPPAAISNPATIKLAQGLLLKAPLSVPTSPHLRRSGVIDVPTVAAIIAYQDYIGLPETGVFDSATVGKLGIK